MLLNTLINRLIEIRDTEKFCGASVTGRRINKVPCLVIQGNEEYLCIKLGDLK